MKPNIDKEFYLTRGEYAKKINKSKGSVIQLMRRGKLNNEYIIKNDWYYFRDPSRERAFKETVHGAIYTPKKIYNRGNHLIAHYPNHTFQQHNELKMLASLQRKVDPRKAAKIPRAIEMIEEEERSEKQRNVRSSLLVKNYGGFISNQQLNRDKFNPTNKCKLTNKKGPYEI